MITKALPHGMTATEDARPDSYRCRECKVVTYCCVDCGLAPWNQDRPVAPSPFAYIMRFRRWLGHPPFRDDLHFYYDRTAELLLGYSFCRR